MTSCVSSFNDKQKVDKDNIDYVEIRKQFDTVSLRLTTEQVADFIDNWNISNPKGKERFYTVVGYICETDTFGTNRQIAEIKEGDILSFKNAGAYCFSMASNYNSRYKPAEVLWKDGKGSLIRSRETMEDILRNQILV